MSVSKKIPNKVVEELNRQFNHELSAAQTYLALSIWCEIQNLKGFARYFVKQAGEEKAHAEKILKHLIDRGVQAEVSALGAPKQEFRTLLDVAQHALAQEQANTAGINSVYEAALAAKDFPAQVLMHWFINEQVEEEDWAGEMVDRVESATCAGSASDLDRHIERYLEEEVREVPAETK
jgi:ferritin